MNNQIIFILLGIGAAFIALSMIKKQDEVNTPGIDANLRTQTITDLGFS